MDQIAANRELADGLLLKVSEATSGITGHDFILELTRKIPSILGMRHCFVAECANEEKTRLRTIAFPEGENVLDNIEYSTSESACREMMGGQPYFLNKGAHLIYKALSSTPYMNFTLKNHPFELFLILFLGQRSFLYH